MKFPILIISYTFPPAKGIGGRRWSKFAKYLAKRGHSVHVICHARNHESELYSDTLSPLNVHVHVVRSFYPKVLSSRPEGIMQKLNYQFWMRVLPLLHSGNIYDRSIFISSTLIKKVRSVCKQHNIEHVMLTCAPFYQSKAVLQVKKELGFHLTVDIRDPWTWGEGYGYSLLSPIRMSKERALEKSVMQATDLITSPSSSIIDHLQHEYQDMVRDKLKLLPHGVDSELFPLERSIYPITSDPGSLRVIYAGSLYEGYDYFLEKLFTLLKRAENVNPEFFGNFSFDVFSMNPFERFEERAKKAGMQEKVKFHEAIPEHQLFKRMKEYNRSLIYFPEKFKDFISTKFYELIYARIPLVFVGYPGLVSRFIEDNGLGVFIDWREFESSFIEKVTIQVDVNRIEGFDLTPYFYQNLTEELVRSIEK